MDLPLPSVAFHLPSVHDSSQLECRVYLPHQFQNIESTAPRPSGVRGAIVAHPYAPLGGCYDDPIVAFIGGELLQAGYIVTTFNFRGAGNSQGRTSWTGKPELGDYVTLYGFMLNYLQGLHSTPATRQNPSSTDGVHLVIGGYSFGSLIASHVPSLEVMLDLFCNEPADPTTPIYEIREIARKIAAQSTRHLAPAKESTADQADRSTPRAVTTISYLLMSPLLPPVSQLLTAFSALSVNVGSKTRPAGQPADQLSTHRTLALYGDQDTFTSARKLQRWSDEMARMPQSQFRGCEITGAGHFWRENGVEARARRALQEWLQS